jgi:hypothetical protein
MQNKPDDIILGRSVLRTLLYFDIFNYPLNADEVLRFLGINSVNEADVEQALQRLTREKVLFHCKGFYGLTNNEETVNRRLKGNSEAKKTLPLAHRQAHLIYKFPFVRAVLASGSLSKNYMDEKSDLDFFVITSPGRLWIARMLIVIYKRVVLRNSFKYFCVNYFVDENHLEIEEKNQFTATELATILPLYSAKHYHKLIEANSTWLKRFFPNFKPRKTSHLTEPAKGFILKKISEILLNVVAKPVEWLFMVLTLKRWKRIYGKAYASNDFDIAFKTKKYVSKNHPRHYQQKIIELYDQKLIAIGEKIKIELRT